MGEKYDDCYYDSGPGRFESLIQPLARVRDPSGPGFPPGEYNIMRGWGEQGRGAFQRYDARRELDVRQMCADATQRLTSAGTDHDALLAAGRDVAERFESGRADLDLHSAQSEVTLSMLDREGTIPTGELADEARASARRLKKAVTDNVGPFEELVGTLFGMVQDRALNAVGAQVEEAVNRIGQTAYTSTARLYRAVRRRGLTDVEAEPPAEPA